MNLNLYLEDALHKPVSDYATKHNISRNSVIRNAIRDMVMDDTPGSMHEVQAHFAYEKSLVVGSIEDLSQFADCKNLKEAFEKMGKKM